MNTLRSKKAVVLAAVVMVLAACGGDEGAEVRNIGADGTASASATGSASGSASASASGTASGSASATASGSMTVVGDGGYDYATDVSAHRLVVADICSINELLDAEPIDFGAVEAIYREGENSVNSDGSVRTLAGFATAEDRLHGLAEYYGAATPLDDFVTAALSGNGTFADTSDAVRRQGVQKGIQNQVMIAWVVHELNAALAKATDGDFDPAEGAVHNWDEAWAFYHGSEPGCAPFNTANSRAENFGTLTDDGLAQTNADILQAMNAGRDALLAEDAAGAEAAAADVLRAIAVTYSQAAIRYATVTAEDVAAGDAEAAATHQAEGLAFWRVIEAMAAEHGADVETVNAIFALENDPAAQGGGDEVRQALQPAWESLGISDDDIGNLG